MALLEKKDVLHTIFQKICNDAGIDNHYKEEQFTSKILDVHQETIILKITFPEPEEESLCYHSYLIFEKDFSKAAVFTIEKGGEYSHGVPFVCAWSKEGGHHNLGNCSLEELDDLKHCVRFYLDNYDALLPEGDEK